jgi:hypothetical protein
MKIVTFLLLVVCFGNSGCMTGKKSLDSIVLKENQKKGTVLHLPRKTRKGLLDEKEFYLRIDNLNYFVKFSESKITPADLKKHVDKTIVIEGTIKNGPWEPQKAGTLASNEASEKARSGMYITIDKILDKKDLTP